MGDAVSAVECLDGGDEVRDGMDFGIGEDSKKGGGRVLGFSFFFL